MSSNSSLLKSEGFCVNLKTSTVKWKLWHLFFLMMCFQNLVCWPQYREDSCLLCWFDILPSSFCSWGRYLNEMLIIMKSLAKCWLVLTEQGFHWKPLLFVGGAFVFNGHGAEDTKELARDAVKLENFLVLHLKVVVGFQFLTTESAIKNKKETKKRNHVKRKPVSSYWLQLAEEKSVSALRTIKLPLQFFWER